MARKTILVVEDERDIADIIRFNLEQEGFQVLTAHDGLEAVRLVKSERPDLVVLDLMLPRMDGKEVCRLIRADERLNAIPVMMLTARAEEIDRIIGFEIGADDYLTKPFSPRELILRIKAILRRSGEPKAEAAPLKLSGMTIDPDRHQVEIGDQSIELTATEFRLLHHLAANAGRVQSRDVLLDRVWGYDFDGYARTVDTHIRRLRKKMGPAGDLIETIRGIGYRFRDPA